jgi:hypothetical protein
VTPVHAIRDAQMETSVPADAIALTLTHHGKPVTLTFAQDATVTDLAERVASELSIPPSNQKFLVSPRTGLLKPPFKEDKPLGEHNR